jgi:Spy/CpxP family protein refolding chaperone
MRLMTSMVVAGTLAAGAALVGAAELPAARTDRRGEMREALGLSDQQRAQIRDLQGQFRKEQIKARADIQVMRLELRELMSADKLDDAAIRAKGKAVADAEAAQGLARVEHRLAIARVLTPEQRLKWREKAGDRRQGHFMGEGRGRHDRGMRGAGAGPGGMGRLPMGPDSGEVD